MKAFLNIAAKAVARLVRNRKTDNQLQPKGRFRIEHWRKGELLGVHDFPNGITNAGKNSLFDTMFNFATQVAANSWFLGIISNASFTAVADTDTMSSHAGWLEFTSYDEATRVLWGQGAASSQSITNATAATFTISATGTLKGVFLVSNGTKGGTTGLLWATALFSSNVPVVDDDELKVTYSVSA